MCFQNRELTHEGCIIRIISKNSDYLGTPVEDYDEQGHKVWSAELDVYERVNEFTGEKDFIPFRYQGQYEDIEIGLYYNRFRYYDPEQGNYTQVDPIGLAGGNPTLFIQKRMILCFLLLFIRILILYWKKIFILQLK
ncbi:MULTISPECIES: RHS repeat domain-containing protein [unclassified Lysinibacillus]|uniref:RHS repeat domain-containing protein n=1 Tax=unclassified Lysinibacillus TaxID=2636778 RepID=UPI0037FB9C34